MVPIGGMGGIGAPSGMSGPSGMGSPGMGGSSMGIGGMPGIPGLPGIGSQSSGARHTFTLGFSQSRQIGHHQGIPWSYVKSP